MRFIMDETTIKESQYCRSSSYDVNVMSEYQLLPWNVYPMNSLSGSPEDRLSLLILNCFSSLGDKEVILLKN